MSNDRNDTQADLKKAEGKEAAETDLENSRNHAFEILVDGEDYETTRHEMTPNEIIREFGAKSDVSQFYLMEISKPENKSFQGIGDIPIRLHNKMEFMVMSLGPATVSDSIPRWSASRPSSPDWRAWATLRSSSPITFRPSTSITRYRPGRAPAPRSGSG